MKKILLGLIIFGLMTNVALARRVGNSNFVGTMTKAGTEICLADGTNCPAAGAGDFLADGTVPMTGDLTLGGIVKDNDDMIFECDANDDGSNSFIWTDGASTQIATLSEAGAFQIADDMIVSGGDITFGNITARIGDSVTDSVSIVTDGGTVVVDGSITADGAITGSNLSGTNTGVRFLPWRVIEATTDVAVDTDIGGDFKLQIAGVIQQLDGTPELFSADCDTAGTTGTMIVDVHLNGTTIMTTNKLDIETTEKSSSTATTQPDLTTTAVAIGDILTIDIDAIHTTACKGLTIYIPILED